MVASLLLKSSFIPASNQSVTIIMMKFNAPDDGTTTMELTVYALGNLDYPRAEDLQRRLAEAVGLKRHPPALLLLEHPHVYTFGRQGKQENLLWSPEELAEKGISVHWTDRGGDVTYHGPGQLVGYPILPLKDLDTLGYLRKLEDVILQTLDRFGIRSARLEGQTGVWVSSGPEHQPPAKIASIGVRVDARRITRHGFALNVAPEMSYWDGMIACGLDNQAKTSMAALLAQPPTVAQVIPQLVECFGFVFSAHTRFASPADLLKSRPPA